MRDFVNLVVDFFKKIGVPATIILVSCVLGVFNLGLFGYKFTAITLFLVIGVTYLISHLPTLWGAIFDWLGHLWDLITGKED